MANEALHEAVKIAGSQSALSRLIGVTQQHISHLLRTGKPVSAEQAVKIEKATGVPRHRLRPDLWESEAA